MADIQYDVLANLTMKGGQFAADMGKAASSADALGASWGKIVSGGSALLGTLAGVGAAAARATAVAGGIALAAVGVGAKESFATLDLLESKSIQLASVLAAATRTPFSQMQQESKGLFEQFRQDAIDSAGETADFIDVAAKIAGPLAGAGRSMADLHKITKGVVEMAPSLGIDFKQAGSDVMRMLQGTAGIESPLFAAMVAIPSLGIKKAEEFNKLSPEARVAKLEQALANPAFRAAADAYGKSWAGVTSTMQDVTRTAMTIVGGPFFEYAKNRLAAFNAVTMASLKGQGGVMLQYIGQRLTSGFVSLEAQLGRVFPAALRAGQGPLGVIAGLVDTTMSVLVGGTKWAVDHWGTMRDTAQAFARHIETAAEKGIDLVTALGGGDLEKGLQRAGALVLAMKAAPVAGAALSMGSGAMGLLSGAARYLPGLAGGAGGAGAAEGAAVGGAALSGPAIAIAAGVIATVGSAIVVFKNDMFGLGTRLSDTWGRIASSAGTLWAKLGGLWDAFGRLLNAAEPLAALIGGPLAHELAEAADDFELLLRGVNKFVDGVTYALDRLATGTTRMRELADPLLQRLGITRAAGGDPPAMTQLQALPLDPSLGRVPRILSEAETEALDRKNAPKDKGKQQIEVVLKWELGEGNEDAIFVRTRRDILDMLAGAKSVARTSRLQGT